MSRRQPKDKFETAQLKRRIIDLEMRLAGLSSTTVIEDDDDDAEGVTTRFTFVTTEAAATYFPLWTPEVGRIDHLEFLVTASNAAKTSSLVNLMYAHVRRVGETTTIVGATVSIYLLRDNAWFPNVVTAVAAGQPVGTPGIGINLSGAAATTIIWTVDRTLKVSF